MEVEKLGRLSAKGRIEGGTISSLVHQDRAKLLATSAKFNDHGNNNVQHYQQQQQQQEEKQKHTKNRSMKVFNKVQVVYYLTRNGHLEHPHYLEVSHFATQPLRLKDVIDRLTVLRGKAMPCQYSWSCKRSYKNGYVWNDLSENDVIYASQGSEYVLKGSELLHERDFSETRVKDLEMIKRQQKKDLHMKTNGLLNKSNATYQRQNYRKIANKYENVLNNNNDDNDEDNEGEEKGSSDSSGAPYPTMIMEQEESYSLPFTSSTNSDKQKPQTPPSPPLPRLPPPQEVPKTSTSESKRFDKEVSRVIEEDGDPAFSTSLTRNSTVLLHLIACGGGGILCPQGNNKLKSNGGSNRNFNFSMKNSFMPCLRQQSSTRAISSSHNNVVPFPVKGLQDHQRQLPCCKTGEIGNQVHLVASKEDGDEDEDMMMVRYMSENPRFGNLQSEEKEYFSGTIVEAMAQNNHHCHTHSSGSNASSHLHSQLPVLTKSSSYNELRCSKGELQAGVASTTVDEEDDEKNGANFKGIIKLCIPRKKSFSSSCTKHS